MTSSLGLRGVWIALTCVPVLLTAACQTPSQTTSGPVATSAAPAPVAEAPANTVDFPVWLATARQEALRRGISEAALSVAFACLAPNPGVIELDGKQPEFSQTFWRYLDNAVSEARVNKGRALMQQNAGLLNQLEARYG